MFPPEPQALDVTVSSPCISYTLTYPNGLLLACNNHSNYSLRWLNFDFQAEVSDFELGISFRSQDACFC